MKSRLTLTLDDAKQIAAAAEAEALKRNWPVTIAIVDDGGNLMWLQRLDGAPPMSTQIAPEKARTCALARKPSKAIEDVVNSGRLAALRMEPADEAQWGVLAAIDLKQRGRLKWTVKTDQPLIGGVLALKSGVVFTGEGDGHLSAFDSLSGKRLWRFQTGAGVNAPPIAYVLDGKPYVAVAAGGSAIWGYRQGDAVVVFGLPD